MAEDRNDETTPKSPVLRIATGITPETYKALSETLGSAGQLARQAESIRKSMLSTSLVDAAEHQRRVVDRIVEMLAPTQQAIASSEATRKALDSVLNTTVRLPRLPTQAFPGVAPVKPIRIPRPWQARHLDMLTETRDAVRDLTSALQSLAGVETAVLTELQSQTEEHRRTRRWTVAVFMATLAVLALTALLVVR